MMNLPKCRPYFRKHQDRAATKFHPGPRSGNNWDIGKLCQAYGIVKGVGVPGGIVGLIEMRGGFRLSDVQTFCTHYGYKMPKITAVNMDLSNQPGDDADVEVALDIQAAIAVAAEAGCDLAEVRVYFTGDFVAGIQQADKDLCDTFGISWGGTEASFGQQYCQQIQAEVKAANKMTITAAAGDGGSTDMRAVGPPAGANLDAPSCVPEILSCGGTTKYPSGTLAEYVWTGTGGGISQFFPQAPWQTGAPQATGRTSPDVSANADPVTGVLIVVNGQWEAIGGTSFVAPLFAGLIATFGRRIGWLIDKLYANPAVFADITSGSNGQYRGTPGIDMCTGLGVPMMGKLQAGFSGTQAPPTNPPTNPPTGVAITGTMSALSGTVTGPLGRQSAVVIPSQTVTITPTSTVHSNVDLGELKKLLTDIEQVAVNLPVTQFEQLIADIEKVLDSLQSAQRS